MRRLLPVLAMLVAAALPAAAGERKVALELVLAVDVSASITPGALAFELRGHAAAFRDPEVAAAVAGGGGIAVTLATFSGPHTLRTLVPWTVIASAADADAFADRILAAPTTVQPDATALGSAIVDALRLFGTSGVSSPRRVIDLVSNGFSNAGPDPQAVRALAVRQGVTVNGLAILDEFSWLDGYFAEQVIAGPGAFVQVAEDKDSFAEAFRRKLIQEIAGRAPDTLLARR